MIAEQVSGRAMLLVLFVALYEAIVIANSGGDLVRLCSVEGYLIQVVPAIPIAIFFGRSHQEKTELILLWYGAVFLLYWAAALYFVVQTVLLTAEWW